MHQIQFRTITHWNDPHHHPFFILFIFVDLSLPQEVHHHHHHHYLLCLLRYYWKKKPKVEAEVVYFVGGATVVVPDLVGAQDVQIVEIVVVDGKEVAEQQREYLFVHVVVVVVVVVVVGAEMAGLLGLGAEGCSTVAMKIVRKVYQFVAPFRTAPGCHYCSRCGRFECFQAYCLLTHCCCPSNAPAA